MTRAHKGNPEGDRRDKEIVKRYLAGQSMPRIASAMGCARGTLAAAVRRAGLTAEGPPAAKPASSLHQIVALERREGKAQNDIARDLGVTRQYISWIEKVGRVKHPALWEGVPVHGDRPLLEPAYLKRTYGKGQTIASIAEQTGESFERVKKAIARARMPVRPCCDRLFAPGELRRLYVTEGRSLWEIGRLKEISSHGVRSALCRAGIAIRSKTGAQAMPRARALHEKAMRRKRAGRTWRLEAASPRQRAVAEALVRGETPCAIARRLRISPPSVSYHLRVVRERFPELLEPAP